MADTGRASGSSQADCEASAGTQRKRPGRKPRTSIPCQVGLRCTFTCLTALQRGGMGAVGPLQLLPCPQQGPGMADRRVPPLIGLAPLLAPKQRLPTARILPCLALQVPGCGVELIEEKAYLKRWVQQLAHRFWLVGWVGGWVGLGAASALPAETVQSLNAPASELLCCSTCSYKICAAHCYADSVELGGHVSRFCQQCGRFQPLGALPAACRPPAVAPLACLRAQGRGRVLPCCASVDPMASGMPHSLDCMLHHLARVIDLPMLCDLSLPCCLPSRSLASRGLQRLQAQLRAQAEAAQRAAVCMEGAKAC